MRQSPLPLARLLLWGDALVLRTWGPLAAETPAKAVLPGVPSGRTLQYPQPENCFPCQWPISSFLKLIPQNPFYINFLRTSALPRNINAWAKGTIFSISQRNIPSLGLCHPYAEITSIMNEHIKFVLYYWLKINIFASIRKEMQFKNFGISWGIWH